MDRSTEMITIVIFIQLMVSVWIKGSSDLYQLVSIISSPWTAWLLGIKGGLGLFAWVGPLVFATEDTDGVLAGSPGIDRLLAGEEIEGGGGSDSTKPGLIVTLLVQSWVL